MKKILLLIIFLLCNCAYAKQGLLPGLWKISFKIKTEDRIIEPAKRLKEILAKMSKQEREQLKIMLKHEAGIDEDGKISVCYTPGSFELEESTISPMGDNCISKIVSSTSSKVVSHFVCENGIRGINTWFIKNPLSYKGVTKIVSPTGEPSEIIYEGNYFAPLCEVLDEVVI